MNNDTEKALGALAGFVAVVLAGLSIAWSIAANSYVVVHMWRWFIMPLSSQIPEITYVWSLGIVMTVRIMTRSTYNDGRIDERKRSNFALIWDIVRPVLWFAIGWTIHQFM